MADSNDIKLGIKVAGAPQAADDLRKVAKAGGEVGEQTGQATADLEKGRKAVGGLQRAQEGLNQAMQGGARGIAGVGQAIGGLVATTGKFVWVGIVVEGLLRAISLVGRLREAFGTTSEAAEKEAKRIADAYTAATAAAEKSAEAAFSATLIAIKKDADDARRALEGVLRAKVALLDDQEAMALAEIDADETLPESERTAKKADVRRSFRQQRASEMEAGRVQQEQIAARQTAETQAAAQAAAAEVQAARDRARDLRVAEDPEAARQRLAENRRRQSVLNEAARAPFMGEEERARREKERDDNAAKIAADEAIVARAGEGDAAYLQKREAAQAAIQAALDRRAKAEELAAAAAEAEARLKDDLGREREVAASAEKRAQVTDDAPAARVAAKQREAEAREAQRATTLDQISSDRANTAARMAQRAMRSADPATRDAAKALDQAARAAIEGGTTEAEAQALLATLTTFRDALAAQKITSARLMGELTTLRQQVATLRTR